MSALRVAIAYDCIFPVNTGGGERVYRRMAEEFVARGEHVTYVTRAQWPPSAPPAVPFDLVSVWRGEIHDAAGVRTTRSALAFAFGLFRHFLRHRRDVDLVVVAALPVLNVFAVRAALFGRPVVIAVDWLEVWTGRKWRAYAGAVTGTIAAVLQWAAVRVGDIRLVNSGFTRTRLQAALPGADPIVLGLLDLAGPPRERGSAGAASDRAPGGAEDAAPYVVFVGRHIADKRLEALPPALAVARRAIPGLEARVVGTGPETERVRAAADAVGVADSVHFLGRLGDDDLDAVVSGAAALVNPSAREGFGLVVAEAAALGVPSVVVAGEDNASVDLVEPGVNGVVATDASAEVLGAAIRAAVEGGDALRRSTAEWFTRERAARNLAVSVDDLLRRTERARR